MVDISAVLDVVSIFFVGLLSGEEFIIFYGVRTPLAHSGCDTAITAPSGVNPSLENNGPGNLCSYSSIWDRIDHRSNHRSRVSVSLRGPRWLVCLGDCHAPRHSANKLGNRRVESERTVHGLEGNSESVGALRVSAALGRHHRVCNVPHRRRALVEPNRR